MTSRGWSPWHRWSSRRLSTGLVRVVVAAGLVVASVVVLAPGPAQAFTAAPAGERAAIATYYGDSGTGRASTSRSPYIDAVATILDRQSSYLARACTKSHAAIVLDVDDTMLSTYDMYVGVMHYRLDRTLKNAWVRHEKFAAVPGMVAFVNDAKQSGCRVIALSGRASSQDADTVANLKKVGYPTMSYYGRPAGRLPSYLSCGAGCSSQQFKTLTRAHLARAGVRIVANIGDQKSDLSGGFSARDIRLPNRMYTIP